MARSRRNPISGTCSPFPRYVWLDFDPSYPNSAQVAVYGTKSEQRANRPDLKPHRAVIILVDGRSLNDVTTDATNAFLARNDKR